MKLYSIIITTAIVLLLQGCETVLDTDKVPQFESKLVVTAFLEPGKDVNMLNVSVNQPLYGDLGNVNQTGNISAFISDGEQEIKLNTGNELMYFSSAEMKVVPGAKYFLRVSSDKGMEVHSECSVPYFFDLKAEVDTFTIVTSTNNMLLRHFKGEFSFSDSSGYENYYRVFARLTTYKKYSSGGSTYKGESFLSDETQLFTDKSAGQDGRLRIPLEIGIYPAFYDSAFLKIYVMNTDKSYYLYHKSIENYEDGENPFAEPVPIYSNIEGGLGVFAACVMDSVVFRLR